ncbi:MAG: hypothetical protein C0514_09195 [Candidatus Puniceispirillum sp.]|nr:hypothetical protein [Candidatus Puniceispirillum sp.]
MSPLILFCVITVCVCVSFSPLIYFKGTAKGRRVAAHIKTMARVRKYLLRGEDTRVAAHLEAFMESYGDEPDMLVLLAELNEDPPPKMALAERALILDPAHPGALFQKALGVLEMGENKDAEETLHAAWQSAKTRKNVYIMKAARLALEGSLPEGKRAP